MTRAVTDNRAQERSNSSSEGGIRPSATRSDEDDEVPAESLRSGPFRLELASLSDQETIAGAIALGDRAAATLGYLPFEAYDDAASRNGLLVALDPDRHVVGYALFSLTPRFVRLSHLTVDHSVRGQGIGRALVDRIAADHSERQGILAWCRHDYGLGPMWLALGFERRGEKRGRGAKSTILVGWWRDLGQPRLST
jgi:GNAT superfamily N-acetyltransferase